MRRAIYPTICIANVIMEFVVKQIHKVQELSV